ncbi:hypothetical protein ACG2F4_05115 [Halalkalibaculum sp. DA3122]|uniref:DISARM anti-phage system protein DrmE domain-containing protein n=1 Tax=Halalkalibaculum sp. DA3122 TaxID=3373607 RepID=UPI0037542A54
MGKIRQEFLEYILELYPELNSIKLDVEGIDIKFSDVNYLLPYLAFTNSLDKKNRLINVFHPPFSDQHKIIPFYIALAVFKKEVDKMRGTLQPIDNNLIVLSNGDKCHLNKIDLENQRILFKYSTRTGYMSFDEFLSPLVRPYSSKQREKYEEIKELVEEYQLIHSSSIRKLLDTPKYIKSGYNSGVIIFTHKGKFRTLFNNLKVSGISIDSRILAVNAVYDKDTHQYRYDLLNNFNSPEFINKSKIKPFILVASYLDIENIEIFKDRYPHLDTIIFDEAENKLNEVEKVIGDIKKGLKSDEEGSLRDVYLLTSDSSLHTYYDLNRWGGHLPFHWISTPKDMSDGKEKRQHIHLINKGSESEIINELESLKRDIGKLFKLINYEEIKPLYDAFKKLIIRYYSFFEPQDFHSSLENLVKRFKLFSEKNLDEEFDKRIIDDFGDITDRLFNVESQPKFQYLREKKSAFTFKNAELVGIISRNKNAVDQRKLIDWFSQFETKVDFIDFNKSLKSIKETNYDILLFFEIRKPYINSLLIHDFPGDIHLILSKYEYNYYRRNFIRVTKILNRITSIQKRAELLNISQETRQEYIEKEDLYHSKIIDYVVNPEVLETDQELEDIDDETLSQEEKDLLYDQSESDIEDLIIQSIKNNADSYQEYSTGSDAGVTREDDVLIIFDDRTLSKVHPNKKYYKIIDEDVSDINDLVIRADQIKKGDDLLLFHIDHDDLLDLLLNKIKLSDKFKPVYELSEKWRNNVKALCDKVGFERASELLGEHIKRKPVTLENWCDGTTLAPHQHKKVIEGLNTVAMEYEFDNMEIMYEVDSIKNASSRIKGLLLSLPRKLKERSVRKLYDLNINVKEENKDEAILIDQILNDVDIKTVSYVLKNNTE